MKKLRLLMSMMALYGWSIAGHALTIGDYDPISRQSGSLEITQLDNSGYLDIVVEISGQNVNYQLKQRLKDVVVITVDDPVLDQDEVFIWVSAQGEHDYRPTSRLISYSRHAANDNEELKTTTQAQKTRVAVDAPARTKVLIHARINETARNNAYDLVDGKLQITITGGINTIGYAVNHLAKANKLNVLILPGDDAVHEIALSSDVTEFEDLYVASDKKVSHIFIDENRRLVRVVGDYFDETTAEPLTLKQNSLTPQVVSLRELFNQVATAINYKSIELIGDEVLLNKKIESAPMTKLEELALLVGQQGGVLDVDDENKLIRVRN